jgi:ABC-type microcin C transport system duplicated ATPase subunit YejF
VQIQKQILDLLQNLQQKKNLGYLFISHDLQVVRKFSQQILVMSKGLIVEQGVTADIFTHPQQEYTKMLLSSQPKGFRPMKENL